MSPLRRLRKMLDEQLLTTLQSVLGQHKGLGFSHRILDHSLFVQPIHRVPVVSLPGTPIVVQRQKEQSQHHFIHFIFVVLHAFILCVRVITSKTSHINRLTNRWSQPLAVAMRTFNFMKPFSLFATLALASGGSAPSR